MPVIWQNSPPSPGGRELEGGGIHPHPSTGSGQALASPFKGEGFVCLALTFEGEGFVCLLLTFGGGGFVGLVPAFKGEESGEAFCRIV